MSLAKAGRENVASILLTTLNAKYIHCAFGLRYLYANMGSLQEQTLLREFDINKRPLEVVEEIVALNPQIVGFGVYIWNAIPLFEIITVLKRVLPNIKVILGGPEISFETESHPLTPLADWILCGEADLDFGHLCQAVLSGNPPSQRIIHCPPPALEQIVTPYSFYSDHDIQHRIIYVEASRGCPFSCEFCISSMDSSVRSFPLPLLLDQFRQLLDRGVKLFKFADRTFSATGPASLQILEFFREHHRPGLRLHFEMVPDRISELWRKAILSFPPGALQFEIGIQTFNEEVSHRIGRKQDNQKIEEILVFLRNQTDCHLHADLIAGLPGETQDSFAAGFDRLVKLKPHEIQVGILKRLRGAPIDRHTSEWKMVYNPLPPYDLLQNKLLSFEQMLWIRRFARSWDMVANSGNFPETTPFLWQNESSAFYGFMKWTLWLYSKTGRAHSISLSSLASLLFEYLSSSCGQDPRQLAPILLRDYQREGRNDIPPWIRPCLEPGLH